MGSGSAQRPGWDTQDSSCGIRISTELRVGYTGFKLWDQDQHRDQGGIHRIQAVGSGSAQFRVEDTGLRLRDQNQYSSRWGHRTQAVGSNKHRAQGERHSTQAVGSACDQQSVKETGLRLWDQDQQSSSYGTQISDYLMGMESFYIVQIS